MSTVNFTAASERIKKQIELNKGFMPSTKTGAAEATITSLKADILNNVKEAVQSLDAMRKGGGTDSFGKVQRPVDISFADYVNKRWGFAKDEKSGTVESFFKGVGIIPSNTTLSSLMSMPDFNEGYRWLIPELIREAVRLGLRKQPLYPNIIAAEENISQPKLSMPYINPSDAVPTKIGEAETIPTGNLSFGQKDIRLQKVGIGLKITDEVIQYTSLNLLTLFMQDMGVQLGMAQDVMAIDVLINGDGNSNAAPVIGTETVNVFAYKDLLRAWIRMGLLGRLPQSMLSNENVALEILMLDEFRKRDILPAGQPNTLDGRIIQMRTPIPTTQAFDVHGGMPVDNQLMLIDRTTALIKFNSQALRMENERIVEKQIEGAYATLTTGFANLFRDGRLIIDKSVTFASQGWPTWMNAGAVQAGAGFRN